MSTKPRMLHLWLALAALVAAGGALAAGADLGQTTKQSTNWVAIGMFGVFVALAVAMDYALKRTRWGRSMNAIGGNREAARRAGINVNRIFTSAFVLCAVLASLGGVLTAARLASASQPAIRSVAPTGEVDSRMTRSPFFNTGAMALLADSM